jgi:hypothetical protein
MQLLKRRHADAAATALQQHTQQGTLTWIKIADQRSESQTLGHHNHLQ